MKPIRVLIVLFFSFQYASGQGKNIYLDTVLENFWGGDIHDFYEETQNLAHELGLQDLTKSNDSLSIRLWRPGAVFELSYDSAGKLKSQYLNYVWKVDRKWKKVAVVFKRNILSADSCQQIEDRIRSTGLANLLESDRSKWHHKITGIFYKIEFATKTNYRFNTFSQVVTIDSSQETEEFKRLQDALFFIEDKIDFWKYFNDFYSKLEPGKYTDGGLQMTHYKKH